MSAWEFLKQLTNPESIIMYGGMVLLLSIIFMENGLIIGFFLPGDSLIFLAGLLCATKPELLGVDIMTLSLSMFAAAVAGCLFGYVFGRRIGPKLFERKDSVLFKKKYLEMTQAFYAKHGGKTLVLGRFLPIIRTFAPILAGVIKVDFKVFMMYNIIGGALWSIALSLIGYFLGSKFPMISHYVEYIVIGFVAITTLVLLRTYFMEKKAARLKREQERDSAS